MILLLIIWIQSRRLVIELIFCNWSFIYNIIIRYADPVQAAAFLFTASQHDMTGVGWVYIGTNWNTMQTYAGLAPDYQNTVREAMNGMVGISPFIGNVAALDESFSVWLKIKVNWIEILEWTSWTSRRSQEFMWTWNCH